MIQKLMYLFCLIFGHDYQRVVCDDPSKAACVCTRCGKIMWGYKI